MHKIYIPLTDSSFGFCKFSRTNLLHCIAESIALFCAVLIYRLPSHSELCGTWSLRYHVFRLNRFLLMSGVYFQVGLQFHKSACLCLFACSESIICEWFNLNGDFVMMIGNEMASFDICGRKQTMREMYLKHSWSERQCWKNLKKFGIIFFITR